MKFLHAMIRVQNLEKSLDFFINKLELVETRRREVEKARFTLIFLATAPGEAEIELTYNWDQNQEYTNGRNFGHLAFSVENIYETCKRLEDKEIEILRPPRDGYMAFIKSPDGISIELLQAGSPLPPAQPWMSRENKGQW